MRLQSDINTILYTQVIIFRQLTSCIVNKGITASEMPHNNLGLSSPKGFSLSNCVSSSIPEVSIILLHSNINTYCKCTCNHLSSRADQSAVGLQSVKSLITISAGWWCRAALCLTLLNILFCWLPYLAAHAD